MRNRISDALNNASAQQSGVAAMEVIDRLQHHQPGEQVIGACAVLLLLCEHYGVPAQDAFTITKNCINHADKGQNPEFRAVRQYVKEEL